MQKPYIPLPVLDSTLIAHIKSEFASQVRLTDRQFPSIGTVALQLSYRRVTSVCLSDSGDVMSCGMNDSTVKVFWLNPAKVRECLGLQPAENSNYLGTDGLKVSLYTDLLL